MPKNMSSSTNIVGAPNTPRSAAYCVSASGFASMSAALARSRSRGASKPALLRMSISTERCEIGLLA